MQKGLILPKLDNNQRKMIAAISGDVGKLFFAAGVVAYFIPSVGDKVSPRELLLSLFLALSFFGFAIRLSREEHTCP